MSTPNEQALIPVTILGSRWLRGGNSPNGRSALLHKDADLMCCLGFCALAVGHTEDEVRDKSYPQYLDPKSNAPPQFYEPGGVAGDAAWTNDNEVMSDKERVTTLTPILKELGFSPTFDLDH